MKAFTTSTTDLLPALAFAVETLAEKETIPALSFMLLESAGAEVRISATSQDLSFTTTVEAICDEPLTVCVKIKQVYDLVKSVGDAVVTFQQQGGVVAMTASNLRYRLLTIPADRFAAIDHVDTATATLSGPLLASMLSAVAFAAETNPNGEARWKALELSAKDGKLNVTGCCGPQLANVETDFDGEFYALVPQRSVALLTKFASQSESLTLALNNHLLTARSSVGTIDIRLSAYAWPDWRPLIQPTYTHAIQCDAETLRRTLSRLLLFCDNDIVRRVGFEWSKDKMVLTCSSPDRGEGREEMAVACNGDTVATAMDGKRLLGLLRASQGTVTWEMSNGVPARFTVDAQQPFSFQCVQLPMR